MQRRPPCAASPKKPRFGREKGMAGEFGKPNDRHPSKMGLIHDGKTELFFFWMCYWHCCFLLLYVFTLQVFD